jgi:SAM-dependent methyltransferase
MIPPVAIDDVRVTIPGFDGSAAADQGCELIEAARRLGSGRSADLLRSWCVPHVFGRREEIFASNGEPVRPFQELLSSTARLLHRLADERFPTYASDAAGAPESTPATVERITGEHYGNLFKGFSPDAYWRETEQLLSTRLMRNGVELSAINARSMLDAGCGGGRYTAAWRRIGARPAVGIDISPLNVADARARAAAAGIDYLSYEEGNVLELPFADHRFDIVFSNGVLHHTRDWRQGIVELVRVLKPGGLGWLYLIEHPGGLFWDSIEILRDVMSRVDRGIARHALADLGIAENRIFYMLDHVMVPINIRLTADEIVSCLHSAGATDVRRLTRGADFDRVERIHRGEPYAREKYGVGEHRFLFSKA